MVLAQCYIVGAEPELESPGVPVPQASLFYKHIGQEAFPDVAVGTQPGIYRTATGWGGGCPASGFIHPVHLILTEPQEVCRIIPVIQRRKRRLRGVETDLHSHGVSKAQNRSSPLVSDDASGLGGPVGV